MDKTSPHCPLKGSRVPTEEVLKRCGQAPVGKLLRQQRLLWLGHCWRMEDGRLPKVTLFGRLEGTRPRGKPPLRWWEDVVHADLAALGLAQSWAWAAQIRPSWKATAAASLKPTT